MQTKDIIKSLRERYNLSIRGLSSHINIGSSGLSKMERGEISLTMKTINTLTHFYNVTSDFLLCSDKEGFILSYTEDENTYYDIVTEEQLDKFIENKDVEESVGDKCINRILISKRMIDAIKRGMYVGECNKFNPYLEFGQSVPPYEHNYDMTPLNKSCMDEKILNAYGSLMDSQKKLVDELILSLAGGNKNGQ